MKDALEEELVGALDRVATLVEAVDVRLARFQVTLNEHRLRAVNDDPEGVRPVPGDENKTG